MFAFAVLATQIIVSFMGVFLSWRRFVVGVTLTPMKLDRVSQTAGVHSSDQPSVALPTPPAEPSTHFTDVAIFIEDEALLSRRLLEATELRISGQHDGDMLQATC